MPLRLFRSRNVAGANAVQALFVAGMFGMFFLGALYLQRVLGYDALEVGLAFLPVTLVIGTLSLGFSERLNTRFGARTTLIPSLVLIVAALALFARAPVDGSYLADALPVMLLLGTGAGLAFPSLMTLAMSGATRSDSGLASGLVNTTLQVGGAVGLAVLATLATTRTQHLLSGGDGSAAALTGGYHLAFIIAAGLVVAALVVAITVLSSGRVEEAEARLEAPEPAYSEAGLSPFRGPTCGCSRRGGLRPRSCWWRWWSRCCWRCPRSATSSTGPTTCAQAGWWLRCCSSCSRAWPSSRCSACSSARWRRPWLAASPGPRWHRAPCCRAAESPAWRPVGGLWVSRASPRDGSCGAAARCSSSPAGSMSRRWPPAARCSPPGSRAARTTCCAPGCPSPSASVQSPSRSEPGASSPPVPAAGGCPSWRRASARPSALPRGRAGAWRRGSATSASTSPCSGRRCGDSGTRRRSARW